ncbi:hypothetical protein DH2020_002172 [Rehmannia glutinosa]|uniref:Uncharacterized protein n=1 Tax=Rehmannia glutinosa TaxID=99300 RepID=A0ABR0XTK4_REHGL
MKLKINKACDLSSISVLPPHSRFLFFVCDQINKEIKHGFQWIRVFFDLWEKPNSITASTTTDTSITADAFTGVSSQHGFFSQFSQNSQDEILTNEVKLGSQERENSGRRSSCLPPISYARDESQMMVSRSSNNLMRKWSGQEFKCQVSEELEHRVGMIETSLSRLGMVLDSVQSDIIQVNKATKEVALEMKAVRQKLIVDDALQSMSKGQEDIKTCLDMGLKSLSDQLKQIVNQENLGEIISKLSALSEKIDTQMAVSCRSPPQEVQFPNKYVIKASINWFFSSFRILIHSRYSRFLTSHATRHLKEQPISLLPKVETGGWTSVKQERATSNVGNLKRSNQIKVSPNHLEWRVVIESDEETDEGFSCLLKEKGTGKDLKKSSNNVATVTRYFWSWQRHVSIRGSPKCE